jgi:hypothetical protein
MRQIGPICQDSYKINKKTGTYEVYPKRGGYQHLWEPENEFWRISITLRKELSPLSSVVDPERV